MLVYEMVKDFFVAEIRNKNLRKIHLSGVHYIKSIALSKINSNLKKI